jgi:hypothetical protein
MRFRSSGFSLNAEKNGVASDGPAVSTIRDFSRRPISRGIARQIERGIYQQNGRVIAKVGGEPILIGVARRVRLLPRSKMSSSQKRAPRFPHANRHFLPGFVWHMTHRCHQKVFISLFAPRRMPLRYDHSHNNLLFYLLTEGGLWGKPAELLEARRPYK